MLWCFYSNLLTFCNKDLLRTNRFPLIQTNTNQSNPLLEDINSLNVQIFLTLLPIKPGHFPMTIPTPCLMPTGPPVHRSVGRGASSTPISAKPSANSEVCSGSGGWDGAWMAPGAPTWMRPGEQD